MRNVNAYNIIYTFTECCFHLVNILYFIDGTSGLEIVFKYFIMSSGKFSLSGAEKKNNHRVLLYQRRSSKTFKRRIKILRMVGKGYIDKNRTFYEGNDMYKHQKYMQWKKLQ